MMTTEEIMQLALDMVGFDQVPPDSAIYVHGRNIRRVMFGIDIGVAELHLAHSLGYDAVIAHHPDPAVGTYPRMLRRHARLLRDHGVPAAEAEAAVSGLVESMEVRLHQANYDHAPSFARLLGMPYMNIHNPLDELGRRIMDRTIRERVGPDDTVGRLVEALRTLPEFERAPTDISIRLGERGNRVGRAVMVHGCGSNGGHAVARAYYRHDMDTVLYIHISYADLERLRRAKADGEPCGNLVVTGHIASDMVGINPFLRALADRGVEVAPVSGCGVIPRDD